MSRQGPAHAFRALQSSSSPHHHCCLCVGCVYHSTLLVRHVKVLYLQAALAVLPAASLGSMQPMVTRGCLLGLLNAF